MGYFLGCSRLKVFFLMCFYDDRISPEIMDLICGVYKEETGQGGEMIYYFNFHLKIKIFPDQVALVSWFPRQNTWNVSELNIGQWIHECRIVCGASQHYSRRWYPSQSTRMVHFDTLYTKGAKTCVSHESCNKFMYRKHVVYYHIAFL